MHNTKNYLLIMLVFFTVIVFTGCDSDMPIFEMSTARQLIDRAEEVKADKYDPDNINKAKEFLYNSHNEVKKDNQSDALALAKRSIEAANKAIETSLPLLARDTLSDLVQAYGKADSLYAEKFAKEKFELAWTSIKHSEKLNKEKKYWESYLNSKQALDLVGEIIATCNSELEKLQNELTALKEQYAELNSNENSDAARDELDEADQNIRGAEKNLSDKDLKVALKNVNAAADSLRRAHTKIYKLSIAERIKGLRDAIKRLKEERGSDFADEDLETATALLNEGEALVDQEKIDEAIEKVDDAENAYNAAKEKTKKGIALEKIETVEKLLEQVKQRDKENYFEKETGEAGQLLSESKDLVENSLYANSIKKADEAENLLHTIAINIEKKYGKTITASDTFDGVETVYIVKYNRKKRDCLWRIALKVYKDASLWPVIYMANKGQIKDPDLIFPGQKFIIPSLKKNKSSDNNQDNKPGIKTDAIKEDSDVPDETADSPDDSEMKIETDEMIK